VTDTQRDTAPYLHLVPLSVWESSPDPYVPEAYGREGFIHCSIGDDQIIAAANRYYRADPRPYLVLLLAPERITSPVRIEDPAGVFPHIFGPLNRGAVVATHLVDRDEDGTFLRIGPEVDQAP